MTRRRAPIGFGDPPPAASALPILALAAALSVASLVTLAGCA